MKNGKKLNNLLTLIIYKSILLVTKAKKGKENNYE